MLADTKGVTMVITLLIVRWKKATGVCEVIQPERDICPFTSASIVISRTLRELLFVILKYKKGKDIATDLNELFTNIRLMGEM